MSLQFHMRNFDDEKRWFSVYHAGCGEAPWHYGVPGCWNTEVPRNPRGGDQSVYVPSDWVVHFGNWFNLIINGLELVEDIGLFIASEGEDEEAIVDAVSDGLAVTKDAVRGAIQKGDFDINKLAKNARKSFDKTCKSIGMDPKDVEHLATEMGLGGNWFFLAGDSYQKHIFHDSDINNHHGWVVLTAKVHPHQNPAYHPEGLANHAFIESGHLIQAYDSRYASSLWKPYDG